ncbi:hypothetical protein HQ544_01080 [Candidatus Falkowbacteria bacterium]|nr:hypothetical protein [Candidatus Falkowbacteria bacterium]
MKLVIFDVSNSACALAVCPRGNSLMIDCGRHNEKVCPVDTIKMMREENGWLSTMEDYKTQEGMTYPLTSLVITHPDADHINNSERVKRELTPYLLSRRYLEDFPDGVIDNNVDSLEKYKKEFCDVYRGKNPEEPNWGFEKTPFLIPMSTLKDESIFETSKIKNNSSQVFLLNCANKFRILFGGDMEEVGWGWLLDKNHNGFKDKIVNGVDILVASHHGHTSGYSKKLIDTMGAPRLSILSKGAEEGDGTNISSSYSQNSSGLQVRSLAAEKSELKYTLTTRSNGNIYIDIDLLGRPMIFSTR